ncbi:MAG: class I SAM-dependent methyltransferase [Bdellovibrionales bacterium]|nr:class I SAM-dependent methyltransferase [Bdellovibrionales bacterium]
MVFLSPENYLSFAEEKQRYELHNNDLQQKGYLYHINNLWLPLKEKLKPRSVGLDFGSGPQPAFSEYMKQQGFQVNTWDPFFANDKSVLDVKYDFITCLEVIEHCHSPRKELEKMMDMLKPNAFLAIGTSVLTRDLDFSTWGYRSDPTHVVFFQPQSIEWIARHWQLDIVYQTHKVTIFRKNMQN